MVFIHERGTWSHSDLVEVAKNQHPGYCCNICKQLLPEKWHGDHIVPLREGGSNHLSNCQVLCPNCHTLKSSRETREAAERKREQKKGVSRFFDRTSTSFIPTLTTPNSIHQYFEKFRFVKT